MENKLFDSLQGIAPYVAEKMKKAQVTSSHIEEAKKLFTPVTDSEMDERTKELKKVVKHIAQSMSADAGGERVGITDIAREVRFVMDGYEYETISKAVRDVVAELGWEVGPMREDVNEDLFEPISPDEEEEREAELEKLVDYINKYSQDAVRFDPGVLDEISEAVEGDSALNALLIKLTDRYDAEAISAVHDVVKATIERHESKMKKRRGGRD